MVKSIEKIAVTESTPKHEVSMIRVIVQKETLMGHE